MGGECSLKALLITSHSPYRVSSWWCHASTVIQFWPISSQLQHRVAPLTACGRAGAEGSGGRPAGRRAWQWAWPEEGGRRREGSGRPPREREPECWGRSCSWGSRRTAMGKGCRGTAPGRWGRSGCRRSCSPGKGGWALPLWGWAGTAAPGWAAGRPGGKHTAGPAWTHREEHGSQRDLSRNQ